MFDVKGGTPKFMWKNIFEFGISNCAFKFLLLLFAFLLPS